MGIESVAPDKWLIRVTCIVVIVGIGVAGLVQLRSHYDGLGASDKCAWDNAANQIDAARCRTALLEKKLGDDSSKSFPDDR